MVVGDGVSLGGEVGGTGEVLGKAGEVVVVLAFRNEEEVPVGRPLGRAGEEGEEDE